MYGGVEINLFILTKSVGTGGVGRMAGRGGGSCLCAFSGDGNETSGRGREEVEC